ncbi:MAG: hypothetical protein HC802_20820 [Caldilineaceae bacterium]|nr:hypothetical protein [Caldilineaceae bacterium]
MPFLALLAGPAWDLLAVQRRWGIPGQAGGIMLFALSIGVQWLGMLVPFALVQDWLVEVVQPLFAPETFTSLTYTPLRVQWRFLSPETIHFAWWKSSSWPTSVDWLGLLTPLIGVLVGIYIIVRQLQQDGRGADRQGHRNWLYGIGLCIIALGILTYYQTPISGTEMQRATRRIESDELAGDAIVSLMPEQYQQFANVYHGELPMYGFLPAREIDGVDQEWLERLVTTYPRIWVMPDYTPAAQSGWERPLRGEHFLLFDARMSEPDGQRLSLYASANSEAMVESGLGTIFGDPSLGEAPITADNGWIRLNGYALTPEVQAGESMLVELRWQSLQDLDYDYHVFVHLLNANHEKLAQRDGQPVQWMWPTSVWQPGQEIIDHYALLLPKEFPQGEYTIAVGLYDPLTGQRLPVSAGRGDYAIEIGPIVVAPTR